MLVVAMDANFRLKNRLRRSSKTEPMLGLGMSYFVDNDPYANFIKDYVDSAEVRILITELHFTITTLTNINRSVTAWGSRHYSTCSRKNRRV